MLLGCQPNSPLETQDPAPADDELSIAEAKAWFTDYLASPANARTSADDGFVKNAYWEYAFEHRFSTKNKVVVVPLLHFKRGQMSGFKQLWVYKDNKKKTTMRVIEYFHAESGKGKVLTLKDFTGYMLVKDWDDTFLGGFELKNNQFVGALSKSSKSGRTSSYSCYIGETCRLVRVGHAEDPSGGYQYWSCIMDYVCVWTDVMAQNDGMNGTSPPSGGGGDGNPSPPDSYYDFSVHKLSNSCEGLNKMSYIQNIRKREINGVKTTSGEIFIFPSKDNLHNEASWYSHYDDTNGARLLSFYTENGKVYIQHNSSSYSGGYKIFEVSVMIHTHPCSDNLFTYSDSPSPQDITTAQNPEYRNVKHLIWGCSSMTFFNAGGTVSQTTKNCNNL